MSEFGKPQEDVPWRFKAYTELMGLKPGLEEAARNSMKGLLDPNEDITDFSQGVGLDTISKSLDVIGDTEVELTSVSYEDDLNVVIVNLFDKITDTTYGAFFGSEMPPVLVNYNDFGRDDNVPLGEFMHSVQNKEYPSDDDCEQIVGMVVPDPGHVTQPYTAS